jgi:hypothetical protein
MMVNSYYGIYQAERGKTAAEIRAIDAQNGGLAAALGQLGSALAAPGRAAHRSLRIRRSVAFPDAPDAG